MWLRRDALPAHPPYHPNSCAGGFGLIAGVRIRRRMGGIRDVPHPASLTGVVECMDEPTQTSPPGLVSIETLRETLWPDPASRPSVRWLRELQARRMVPFLKIGSKVYFEPERVRAALRRFEQTVEA